MEIPGVLGQCWDVKMELNVGTHNRQEYPHTDPGGAVIQFDRKREWSTGIDSRTPCESIWKTLCERWGNLLAEQFKRAVNLVFRQSLTRVEFKDHSAELKRVTDLSNLVDHDIGRAHDRLLA